MIQYPSLTQAFGKTDAHLAAFRPLYELEHGRLAAVEMPFKRQAGGGDPFSDGVRKAARAIVSTMDPGAFLCFRMGGDDLDNPHLAHQMARLASTLGSAPSNLCLFFSDQDCLKMGVPALDALLRLKRAGLRLGLDIHCLETMPVLFVERLPADVLRLGPLDALPSIEEAEAPARLTDFVRFAANLLMTPAAMGVRTNEQLATLRRLGIRIAQGPFFMGAEQAVGWVEADAA